MMFDMLFDCLELSWAGNMPMSCYLVGEPFSVRCHMEGMTSWLASC